MIRRTLQRLAAMPAEELRFRALSEARKVGGRIGTTVSHPGWHRSTLSSILDVRSGIASMPPLRAAVQRGDHASVHGALGSHFATRAPVFAIGSRDVASVATAVRQSFPLAPDVAAAGADSMIAGRYDLLGYRGLELGDLPDWHGDIVHGRRAPRIYWSTVPFLDPAAGDHKVIWELNRHQHWLAFGRAHALSGERRFYDAFTRQLSDWLAANPPLVGVNWASMLELAFRCLSWLWALELFAACATAADREPWIVDLLVALDRQLTHVEHNLSHYFSPNTHLSGEALALYCAGCALPELKASARRAAIGRAVLIQEATRQIRPDGGHAELSTHYHRYSTDFYLLATRLARCSGDPAASIFEDAARKQARYLRTICDASGQRPQIGDDDGGQLFPMCGRPPEDCRDTLASAALLLSEPALAIGPAPEESYWLCGAGAVDLGVESTQWPSTALTSSGYYVSRTPGPDHLVFDAGPHGFLNGGHAHSDALSCTLTVGGRPLLIDPGTATYTMDRELRDRFRGTMMHNTLVLGGRPQSEPGGPFEWRSCTAAEAPIWHSGDGCDYVEGTHAAYAPARHTRAILAVHGIGWWILDHLLGADASEAESFWHIHPSWEAVAAEAHVCRLTSPDGSLALASTADIEILRPGTTPLAVTSPAYGSVEAAPVIKTRRTANAATTIATFIPATAELARHLAIEELALAIDPGDGWHGCGYRVRWADGAMIVCAAIEPGGVASSATAAPARQWGTADLQTDARVAAIVHRRGAASEVIVINGARLDSSAAGPLVSLSHPQPVLRARAAVAPTVHEVEGAAARPLQSSTL